MNAPFLMLIKLMNLLYNITLSNLTSADIIYLIQIRTHENVPDNKTQIKTDANKESSEISNELTGNFLERTLQSVLINVLKTEDGRIFFENILKPINKPLNQHKQSLKVNNTDFINSMFQVKTFGEGEVGPASCGHVVTINYQISIWPVIGYITSTRTMGVRFIK